LIAPGRETGRLQQKGRVYAARVAELPESNSLQKAF
jgi:hypothetical protein